MEANGSKYHRKEVNRVIQPSSNNNELIENQEKGDTIMDSKGEHAIKLAMEDNNHAVGKIIQNDAGWSNKSNSNTNRDNGTVPQQQLQNQHKEGNINNV